MNAEGPVSINSRAEFHAAIRTSLAYARQLDAAEIYCTDPTFADWPLNERDVIASLDGWVGSRRRLFVFGHDFSEMGRRQHRFVEWRRRWAHVVQCRSDDELEAEQVPTLLFIPGAVCLRLLDRVRYRGTASDAPVDLAEGRECIDALLQRSTEAFPVTTLGL